MKTSQVGKFNEDIAQGPRTNDSILYSGHAIKVIGSATAAWGRGRGNSYQNPQVYVAQLSSLICYGRASSI